MRVNKVEAEEVMVVRHLYIPPQTVTVSNGSDSRTKKVGRSRGGMGSVETGLLLKTSGAGEKSL